MAVYGFCSVPECNAVLKENVKLHKFPEDEDTMQQWVYACNITKGITKYNFVCSAHFVDNDYLAGERSEYIHLLLIAKVVNYSVVKDFHS